jgi:ferredoxin
MKVRVDADRCQGHNRCYAIAPDLFTVDDFGIAHAASDDPIPGDREAAARRAALDCPEQAVVLEDDGAPTSG